MRRLSQWSILLIVLIPVLAVADPVGLGVTGGFLAPVGQEDQGSGSIFGIRMRADLGGHFTLEPNINFGSYGETEIAGVGSRDGSSLNHYGVDITFGGAIARSGLKPYLFIGGGIYSTKRDGDLTTNKSGWSFGAGFAVGVKPEIDIDFRGRFNVASSEGSTSRKAVGVTAGVTYYFGSY